MASGGSVFLMYHELELPGRPLVQSGPGYVRYILREATFRAQIEWLAKNGWRGLSVGQALRGAQEKSVVITVDDGCETDLIAAAPVLHQSGFQATFYVTASFLGKPGYLSAGQLRELQSAGFEIGCHSMTHAYLNDLGAQQLQVEVVDARSKLEDILGSAVEHFSCPGGRCTARAIALARDAGYRSLATSRAHLNFASTDPFQLGRVAVMRNITEIDFAKICAGKDLWKIRVADSARSAARNLLGNRIYDRVRKTMLRET